MACALEFTSVDIAISATEVPFFLDMTCTRLSIKGFVFREPSLSEKKAYANAVERLEVAQKLLGRSYCILVLGLGMEKQHHMECGV